MRPAGPASLEFQHCLDNIPELISTPQDACFDRLYVSWHDTKQPLVTIRSFRSALTEAVAAGKAPKGFPADLVRPAVRKLVMLESALTLEDLRSPPGNRLEALKGDLVHRHSIRINDQWRIVFIWKDGDAYDVEIVDYH